MTDEGFIYTVYGSQNDSCKRRSRRRSRQRPFKFPSSFSTVSTDSLHKWFTFIYTEEVREEVYEILENRLMSR